MVRRASLIAVLATLSGMAVAGDARDLAGAVAAGEAQVALRYRYEYVDQEGFANDARASTLRLRIGYKTAEWRRWRAFGEFDYVGELLADDYNSGGGTSPERAGYPVVADPDGADLNQLYAEHTAGAWRSRFGRQRILLDDHRFVGHVGWRQNEQTFDAVSFQGKLRGDAKVFYAWVGNANRIFGDTVSAGDHRMNTHLLRGSVSLGEHTELTPYGYLIDNDDDPTASTATFGARLHGTIPSGPGSFSWILEFATQSDAGNAPVEYDAEYLRAEGQWTTARALTLAAGLESLGGDRTVAGTAFRTPLATLHAFQGWADQFLATPDAGIRDLYGRLSQEYGRWRFEAVYHDFSADAGGADYGRELDLSAALDIGERYVLLLKSAHFNAAHPAFNDTDKLWLMLSATY